MQKQKSSILKKLKMKKKNNFRLNQISLSKYSRPSMGGFFIDKVVF